jgi:hypothetical protein
VRIDKTKAEAWKNSLIEAGKWDPDATDSQIEEDAEGEQNDDGFKLETEAPANDGNLFTTNGQEDENKPIIGGASSPVKSKNLFKRKI